MPPAASKPEFMVAHDEEGRLDTPSANGADLPRLTPLEQSFVNLQTQSNSLLLEQMKAGHAAIVTSIDNLANAIKADTAAEEKKGEWYREIAKELWGTFKQPLAGLLLAMSAYWAWRYFQVPPTPTPLQVQVGTATAPGGSP